MRMSKPLKQKSAIRRTTISRDTRSEMPCGGWKEKSNVTKTKTEEYSEAIKLAIAEEPHPLTFGDLLFVLAKMGTENPSPIFAELALRQLMADGKIRNMMAKRTADVKAGIFYVPDRDSAQVMVSNRPVETTRQIA